MVLDYCDFKLYINSPPFPSLSNLSFCHLNRSKKKPYDAFICCDIQKKNKKNTNPLVPFILLMCCTIDDDFYHAIICA